MSTRFLTMPPVSRKPLPRNALHCHNLGMAWNDKIKKALAAKLIGAPQLAEMIGVKPNMARYYLAGTYQPSLQKLWAICRIAGVSADWVLDDSRPSEMDASVYYQHPPEVPAQENGGKPAGVIRVRDLPPPKPARLTFKRDRKNEDVAQPPAVLEPSPKARRVTPPRPKRGK